MGNHPSSTSANPPTTHGTTSSYDAGDSRSSSRGESHNIMAKHATPRVTAPPEESLASATRSNVIKNAAPLQPVNPVSSPPAPAPAPQQAEERAVPVDAPSKPVDVPMEPSSARSHHAPEPQNSINDVSYLRRPPRLPLPIEEELHTPGSPIIAPAEGGESVADVEALDSDMTRKSSALSGTSVDDEEEEDGGGLVTDRTRPTVPTTLRWLRGGEKIYITGTIFHWNRKHRLQPV